MGRHALDIVPYDERHLDGVLSLALRAWKPVFPIMRKEIPSYIYQAFYPEGWEVRQCADIEATCCDGSTDMYLAFRAQQLVGFIGLRARMEDRMGEIYVIAVDPDHQQQGVGSALIEFGFDWMRERDLALAMVETGGDGGHAPARAAYEHAGFEQLPVARYFRKL